jgi:hypothetical protein
MFQLDQAIAKWRRKMAADGLKTRALLDELESHLRDDVERQMQSGHGVEPAFQAAVARLGQAGALKDEFSKIGETNEVIARLKYFFQRLAGIQNPILATNMNTSSSRNFEPTWATYLKSGAFALPAAVLWLLVAVFVFPKFNEVLSGSRVGMPEFLRVGWNLALLLTHYLFPVCGAFALAIVFLEWRSEGWKRYRKPALAIGAFLLNSAVLIAITAMVVLSLVAAAPLAQHAK